MSSAGIACFSLGFHFSTILSSFGAARVADAIVPIINSAIMQAGLISRSSIRQAQPGQAEVVARYGRAAQGERRVEETECWDRLPPQSARRYWIPRSFRLIAGEGQALAAIRSSRHTVPART